MATNLRVSYVSSSGPAVDLVTGTTLTDTRIRGVHATGIGQFSIVGTSVDPFGTTIGNIIRFDLTSVNDSAYQEYTDAGIRMAGKVSVTLPVSAASMTIYYG
jgi:hypothetical protein